VPRACLGVEAAVNQININKFVEVNKDFRMEEFWSTKNSIKA